MDPDVVLEGPGSGIQQSRDFLLVLLARVSVGLGGRKMSAVICVVGIGVVAAMLFVAFNNTEPNRRLASVLKLLIIFVSVAAIAGRVMP